VTSNPSIFEKAIVGSTDYQDILMAPKYRDFDAKALYEEIAIRDVRDAADILRPIYDSSKAGDGYVSLEVLVDDKIRILTAIKWAWGKGVTTVFPRQGHCALDQELVSAYPPADYTIDRIGELVNLDFQALTNGGAKAYVGDFARHLKNSQQQ